MGDSLVFVENWRRFWCAVPHKKRRLERVGRVRWGGVEREREKSGREGEGERVEGKESKKRGRDREERKKKKGREGREGKEREIE